MSERSRVTWPALVGTLVGCIIVAALLRPVLHWLAVLAVDVLLLLAVLAVIFKVLKPDRCRLRRKLDKDEPTPPETASPQTASAEAPSQDTASEDTTLPEREGPPSEADQAEEIEKELRELKRKLGKG